MTNLIQLIENASTREEVKEIIKNLKKKEILELCKYFNVYCSNSMSKSELEMRLVEGTVGSRLRFDGLLNLELHSKY